MEGQRYTKTAIVLHWAVALGVLANIMLAWIWPYAADENVRPMIDKHKAIGLTILGLAVLRLLWRLSHRPPVFPASYRPWERNLAHIVHWGLYFVIFAMPITGYVMDSAFKDAAAHPILWFGLFEIPRLGFVMNLPPDTKLWVHDTFGAAHEVIAYFVYTLFALHLAGALKHQLEGHRELQRMGLGRAR
jgi:cytochrome b561